MTGRSCLVVAQSVRETSTGFPSVVGEHVTCIAAWLAEPGAPSGGPGSCRFHSRRLTPAECLAGRAPYGSARHAGLTSDGFHFEQARTGPLGRRHAPSRCALCGARVTDHPPPRWQTFTWCTTRGTGSVSEPGFHHRPEGPSAPSHEGASSLPVRDRLGGNLVAMLAPVRARYAPETGTIGMRFRDQPARRPAEAGPWTDPGVRQARSHDARVFL